MHSPWSGLLNHAFKPKIEKEVTLACLDEKSGFSDHPKVHLRCQFSDQLNKSVETKTLYDYQGCRA